MSVANALHTLIADVCPILGVRIDQLDDRSTWQIDFSSEATDAQKSAASGVIEVFDPLRADVPQSVTPRQARLALFAAGLLDQVEAAVKAAGGATQITWDYATVINRNDALIATLGSALGLTDAAIDALFTRAATL